MNAIRWKKSYPVKCVFEVKDPMRPTKVIACGKPSVGEMGSGKRYLCEEHFSYCVGIMGAEIVSEKGDLGPNRAKRK